MSDNSFKKALNVITEAADLATADKDYISYTTVLDIYLSHPRKYTEEEREQLLDALYNVLKSNDDMIYEIGWDLPQLLMKYLSTLNFERGFKHIPLFQSVVAIFNLLSTKGNFKELFLQAAEGIHQLRVKGGDKTDEDDIEDLSDSEEELDEAPDDPQQDAVQAPCANDNASTRPAAEMPDTVSVSSLPETETDETKIEQLFDVKFYFLYELLLSCIKNIKTQYPSRFLASTVSACLSCLTTNISQFSILSVGVIMRRYFVLIRDYSLLVDDSEISEDEMRMQRKLLGILLTWTIRICLDRFSVQWSQRLFYEMKAGLAKEKSEIKRKESYRIAMHTFRLTQIMERFSQTAYSFDIDPIEELKQLITKEDLDIEAEAAGGTFSSLSSDGLILLATQAMFDSRDEDVDISFADIVKFSLRLVERDGDIPPLGVQDAIGFWGLWTTQDITKKDVQAIDKETLFKYLQNLMLMSTKSNDKTNRYLLYSLSIKILGLADPDAAFEYLIDTLAYCPYETVKDAGVRMLKCLFLKETAVDQLADKLSASSISAKPQAIGTIDMTSERRSTIQDIIDKTLKDIEESGGLLSESLPVFLSWINFASIISLDSKFIESIVKRGRALSASSKVEKNSQDEVEKRKTIVNISLDSLENKNSK